MNETSLFYYQSYRDYIVAQLGPNDRSGRRGEFAKAIECQPSQLSQILADKMFMSPEQATLANDFLKHTEIESQYFLNLVLLSRAASEKTKRIYQEILNNLKSKALKVSAQLSKTNDIDENDKSKYYGHWKYAAVQMLAPLLNDLNITPLAERMRLERSEIEESIRFLLKTRLLSVEKQKFIYGKHHIHLDNDSAYIRSHHQNWRVHALHAISEKTMNEGVHYSVLYSLSKEDFKKIRSQILKLIKKNLEIVAPSAEETVCVFTTDFYELL